MNKIESQLSLPYGILLIALFVIGFALSYYAGKEEQRIETNTYNKSKVIGYPTTIKESQEMWSRTPDQLYFAPGIYK
jgi:uncharacterized protein (UPF0333 family)